VFARLQIVYQPVTSVTPYARNARTHSKKQVEQIAASMRKFGWTNPIIVDDQNMVIAGHGRLEAAKQLGMTEVPTVKLSGLTPEQVRALILTDNRLAQLSGWDEKTLALELQDLLAMDLDFDVGITGWDTGQIDVMIAALEPEAESSPLDEVPEPEVGPPVTRLGDLWQIGVHRILCGNALEGSSYAALMSQEKARMVFTDEPYNVKISGHVSGLGKARHREFPMASGEMSTSEFRAFNAGFMGHIVAHSVDGAIHFLCIDFRHVADVLESAAAIYGELKNICVWVKTNGGMGSLYRSQHEFVCVLKVGSAPHVNNVELGKHGRYRTNVWSYAGVNSFGKGRDEALAMHPTVKPVALVADAIRDCSKRRDLILDCFAGSGTTLVAAHTTGRRGYGIELDPHYVDTIVRRMEAATGETARLAETGESFAEVQARRAGAPAAAASPAAEAVQSAEVVS